MKMKKFNRLLKRSVQHAKTHVLAISNLQIWDGIPLCVAYQSNIRGVNTSTIKNGVQEGNLDYENLVALCIKGNVKEAVDILHGTCTRAGFNTYALLVKECANRRSLEQGKRVHDHMNRNGFQGHVFLGNIMIDMYVKCGSLQDACQVFDKMPHRSTVAWNAMISGYTQHDHDKEALKLFSQMVSEGLNPPDLFSFASVLRACARIKAIEQGKQVHGYFIKTGFQVNVFVGSALVDMYAKCWCVDNAREVFDKMSILDVVLWTSMIAGYVQNDKEGEALKLFSKMQRTDMKPNQYTFASILSACASITTLDLGRQTHANAIKTGYEGYNSVLSGLVNMYGKCRNIEDAQKVFGKMSEHSVVSWTAMITGYEQNDYGEEALRLFRQMQQAGIKPNQFTFASAVGTCARLAVLQQGKQVHSSIVKNGYEKDIFVETALVDLYSKCGIINDAHILFDQTSKRDVVSWNSMIVGYAQNGFCEETIQLFEEMQQSGMKPNAVTFVGILSACSHAGLLNKGRYFFNSMIQDHGIAPTVGHYACMVDILGRAGCLAEAEDLIQGMPFQPDSLIWRTLLGACRMYGNVEIGKHSAERVLELEPEDDAAYVLLSNIYAAAGKWDEVEKVRNTMKARRVKKEPGLSWIEVKSKVHAFVAGDKSHPQTEEIYAKLKSLTAQMKEAGYLLDKEVVYQDI